MWAPHGWGCTGGMMSTKERGGDEHHHMINNNQPFQHQSLAVVQQVTWGKEGVIIGFAHEVGAGNWWERCSGHRCPRVNSLSAMDGRDRPLKNCRSTVVSCRIFIGSRSLIACWRRNNFSLPAVARKIYEACFINDVSRGSKSYLFSLVNIVRYLPICALCR
jgi:hypothetical protein